MRCGIFVVCLLVFQAGAGPVKEIESSLDDPVGVLELSGGGVSRVKREGDGKDTVSVNLGDGRRTAVYRRRKRQRGKEGFGGGGKNDGMYRKKVRPVEKPITPYFVRILKRKPVGPSAMNYSSNDNFSALEDNGEVIDVPKVLVDKRRNKNVDIHPIYVVEDEGSKVPDIGDQDFDTRNETIVIVPNEELSGHDDRDDGPGLPETTELQVQSKGIEISDVNEPVTVVPTPVVVGGGRIPVVRFTRIGVEAGGHDQDTRDHGGEAQEIINGHGREEETVDKFEKTGGDTYYPDYKVKNGSDGERGGVDYLPLEYDYAVEGVGGRGQVIEGGDGSAVSGRDFEPSGIGSDRLEVISGGGGSDAQPLRLITLRGGQDELSTTTTDAPSTTERSAKAIYAEDEHGDQNGSRKRNLDEGDGDLGTSSNAAVYGDYGYNGFVVGGREEKTTTTTTTVPTTTTTTTARPTTTTTTTTTPPPTTTSTTTTTTTTTTPPPTTTTPTTTTTTTTPVPTTSTTTTTTTTAPPTTTRPRRIRSTTTPLPTPTKSAEETLLSEILNSLPVDDDPSLTQQDATTLQHLLLAHLLTSTPATPHDSVPQYSIPYIQYTNPPDLQTSASTTTGVFSTRADVDVPRTTTTRNPILLLFDNLTGNSNQQQRSAEPQGQVVSIVRPITADKSDNLGGNLGGSSSGGGDLLRTMLALPGNVFNMVVRVARAVGEMGMNALMGFIKFMSGITGGGGSGGGSNGLFGR